MLNETYLTAVPEHKQSVKASIPQENETEDTVRKPPFLKEDYFKLHERKTSTAQAVKADFISYLIQEKTHYANFVESEEFYQQKLDGYIKRHNSNKLLLTQKHTEYAEVLLALEDTLLDFYIISDGNLVKHYKTLIDQVKERIRISEHDFECYQSSYRRLYKSNFLIKKRLEDEHKYQYSNDNQYEKYIILKNNALQSVIKQASLANNLYQFYGASTKTNEEEFAYKIKLYGQCEHEVLEFKRDLKQYEDALSATLSTKTKVIEEISFNDRINLKGLNDYRNAKKEYNVFKGKLLMLYSFLNVKNVREFMIEVNNQRRVNQSLTNQFNKINDVISRHRITLSELNSIANNLSNETIKKHSNFLSLLYVNDCSNQLLGGLSQMKFHNESTHKKMVDAQEMVKRLLLFLCRHIDKMLESRGTDEVPECFRRRRYFVKRKDDRLGLELSDIAYDGEFYAIIIELFWDFARHFYVMSSKSFDVIAKTQLNEESSLEEKGEHIVSPSRPNQSLVMSLINQYDIIGAYNEALNSKAKQIEARKEQISRNDDKNNTGDTNERDQLQGESRFNQEISAEDIYYSYLNYLNRQTAEDKEQHRNYFKLYPRRSLKMINTFSTHLVDKKKRNKTQKKLTIAKQHKLKPKEQSERRMIRRYSEDSFEQNEHKDVRISPIIAPRKKQFGSLLEHEKYMLYYRMDDLRKLELNFFKNKNKESAQLSNYSEMFFQFKRRFNQTKQKKKRYDILESKYKSFEDFKKKMKRNKSMLALSQKANLFALPQFKKNISTGSLGTNTMKDMNSTMITLFPKGVSSTTSKFNLTNRITTPESNFNKTYNSGFMHDKPINNP